MLSAPGHGRTDFETDGGMSDLEALNKNILLVRGFVTSLSSDSAAYISRGRAETLTLCHGALSLPVWISRLEK